MRRILAGIAAVFLLGAPAAQAGGPVVVELFTSQGCSSCPPADAWLEGMADRPDVIALSMHVDYWDYLGWRDTFASEATTSRQYAYSSANGSRTVWTPQIVVQGRPGQPGEGQPSIESAIELAAAATAPAAIRFSDAAGMLHAMVEPGGAPVEATVWVVTYDQENVVRIERGENRGREIVYRNVVRSLNRIGTWDGRTVLDLPVPRPGSGEGVVVLLHAGDGGPIIAAARIEG